VSDNMPNVTRRALFHGTAGISAEAYSGTKVCSDCTFMLIAILHPRLLAE
jgi:hypothetical protein